MNRIDPNQAISGKSHGGDARDLSTRSQNPPTIPFLYRWKYRPSSGPEYRKDSCVSSRIFRSAASTCSFWESVNRTGASNYPTLKLQLETGGGWDVSFDPKWGGPAKIRFEELTNWIKHAEKGINFYSETAIYQQPIYQACLKFSLLER